MPELPEVETIRQDLRRNILRKKIEKVKVVSSKTIKNSPSVFQKKLEGCFFSEVDRIGKLLIFKISSADSF
ncbi:MAG: hypothetical protein PHW92_14500, partial [Lutibacter sp.]|nr:hypothetical protein [Lutibacter sp.]